MLEEGIYPGRAREWKIGEAATGTRSVAILFDVKNYDGKVIAQRTHHAYLTDAAYARSVETLRACGWEGYDLSDLNGLDKNEVDLVVRHETYTRDDGTPVTNDRIAFVNRKQGLALKTPLQGDALRRFADEMKGKILALDQEKGRRQRPAQQSDLPMGGNDDDIPF